jgi:hypothetical protein
MGRRIAKIQRPRLQRRCIGAPAEVAHGQVQVRVAGHQQRLEVIEELQPLAEGVADEHHPLTWLEPDRLGSQIGRQGDQEGRESERAHLRIIRDARTEVRAYVRGGLPELKFGPTYEAGCPN